MGYSILRVTLQQMRVEVVGSESTPETGVLEPIKRSMVMSVEQLLPGIGPD